MLQFTQDEIVRLRERLRGDTAILAYLEEQVCDVREHFRVPATGIATWEGFYACPKHSVRLEFDITDPEHFTCPVDGEVLTGEPYAGAWWRILNTKNYTACHCSALLYLLTGEAQHLELSRRLLLEYAAYYPGYEVHGGIPYNNPGKANAQTLCDSMWIKGLAMGYDIIRADLPVEDRRLIEQNLLRPCGEFLMEYRMDQLHNHEVIVDASVGMLGLLLGEERLLDFALHSKYGLHYQLEHAVLADGFWFEGTPSYHFFAMEQYILFEFFARHTPHSFFRLPAFADILKFPLRLLQPDGRLPLLGDAGAGNTGFDGTENIYELAYAMTGDDDFALLLDMAYGGRPRNNLYAFFFGAQTLPPVSGPVRKPYHGGAEGASGLTTMHGPDGRFLLVKHAPFGGEHDHYDRLGIHFLAMGKYAAPDLGTCLYGAPLHYGYYKNTASHNTVCINGENQPPANCRVLRYEQGRDHTLLDAEVRWDGSYQMLDSLTIPQWSEQAYRGAAVRRVIAWYGDFFVDRVQVCAPEERTIDWTFHVRGQRVETGSASPLAGAWSGHGAGRFLHSVEQAAPGTAEHIWDLGDGVRLCVHALPQRDCRAYYAAGPDNPSVSDLCYLIQRVQGTQAQFVNVISAYRDGAPVVAEVKRAEDSGALVIRKGDGSRIELADCFYGGQENNQEGHR